MLLCRFKAPDLTQYLKTTGGFVTKPKGLFQDYGPCPNLRARQERAFPFSD